MDMDGRKPKQGADPERPRYRYHTFSLVLVGMLLGLALLKFGNPVIFEGRLPPPGNLSEVIHFNWPIQWGWALAVVAGLILLPGCRLPRGVPKWLLIAPTVWLIWQGVAAVDSIQPQLSRLTLIHFVVVVGCFYFGLLSTRGARNALPVWIGIGIGLCLVISEGFRQQFGGLEETRVFYEKLARGDQPPEIQAAFERPEMRAVWQSPLFQFKVNSRRIYSTLFYPNTLAGVLLLLTPGLLGAAWVAFAGASQLARTTLTGLLGVGALLCLVWSGSKAGQGIAVLQSSLLLWVLLKDRIPAKWRRVLVASAVAIGVASLLIHNLDYFKRGARSVGARADYWLTAGRTLVDHPFNGTGPGTFGEAYAARKAADSEMARLAHNDFVQQGSDSGVIGFVSYLLLVLGALGWIALRLRKERTLVGLVLLGVFGWAVQSLAEFGLYIPAVAWPAFFLLGVLVREAANRIDSTLANP